MTHLLDDYLSIPFKVLEKMFNDGVNIYQNILNYGIYEDCITLAEHIDLNGAAMMVMFHYYKGDLTSNLSEYIHKLIITGRITEHREIKDYLFYNQNPTLDVSDLVNCIEKSEIIEKEVLEFCSLELGKDDLTDDLSYNTIDVIETYRKYYEGPDDKTPILVSTKKIIDAIKSNKCVGKMDEKDFLTNLLSKTKEQSRKIMRDKYSIGSREREEIERKFEWEDRYIPDSEE